MTSKLTNEVAVRKLGFEKMRVLGAASVMHGLFQQYENREHTDFDTGFNAFMCYNFAAIMAGEEVADMFKGKGRQCFFPASLVQHIIRHRYPNAFFHLEETPLGIDNPVHLYHVSMRSQFMQDNSAFGCPLPAGHCTNHNEGLAYMQAGLRMLVQDMTQQALDTAMKLLSGSDTASSTPKGAVLGGQSITMDWPLDYLCDAVAESAIIPELLRDPEWRQFSNRKINSAVKVERRDYPLTDKIMRGVAAMEAMGLKDSEEMGGGNAKGSKPLGEHIIKAVKERADTLAEMRKALRNPNFGGWNTFDLNMGDGTTARVTVIAEDPNDIGEAIAKLLKKV